MTGSQLEKIGRAAMQKPFPVLTHLYIGLAEDGKTLVLPGGFLGGSAPCLQKITCFGVSLRELPTLFSSASDLVELGLYNARYVPAKVTVEGVVTFPRLATFRLAFQPNIYSFQRPPPPITRTVLPALTEIEFKGAGDYLEDLVELIDVPQLNKIRIDYHYLSVRPGFQVAQLSKFIDHSVGPEVSPLRPTEVYFYTGSITFDTYCHYKHSGRDWSPLRTIISCGVSAWHVSGMAQVLNHFSTMLSTVAHLKLMTDDCQLEGIDDDDWPHFLRQFSSVQALYVSRQFGWFIALALEDITGEMVAEAFSSLDLLCLEGQSTSSVEKFVAVRQLSGRPVTIVSTEAEFDQRLKSYIGK